MKISESANEQIGELVALDAPRALRTMLAVCCAVYIPPWPVSPDDETFMHYAYRQTLHFMI